MCSASVCRFCATGRTTCFSKKKALWGLCRTRIFVISGAIPHWTLPQDGQHVCTTKNIHALGVYAGRVFFCHSWRNFALDSATGRRTCFILQNTCPSIHSMPDPNFRDCFYNYFLQFRIGLCHRTDNMLHTSKYMLLYTLNVAP